MTVAETHQILAETKRNERDYPRDKCIHELFEEQAERAPDAVAVVFEGNSLTYGELNARSNQLAWYLREKHETKADGLVGLLVERSLEMVVGILGILKAGGAYVPIDPNYPEERIRFMVDDAGLKVVLGQEAHLANLPPDVVGVDLTDSACYEGRSDNPESLARPSNLCYVIYTSGSTGTPKGTMLEHAGLVNRLFGMADEFGADSDSVLLQKTPYTFDVSVWELLLWAVVGTQVIMLKPGGQADPREIARIIEKHRVTMIHFVPSMLRIFLDDIPRKRRFPGLKWVICSGEALTVDLKNLFFERMEGSALHNLYGPTEASIDVTSYAVRQEDRAIPIGKPVANTRAYVLGENGQPVPVGATGELCFAGVQVARGYLNRPELTAEKFIEDPLYPGERLYRTGDIGRWLPDGNLECLGRMDHQVKIHGQRIELGEVEAALLMQSGVKAAVVTALAIEDGDKELVAFVVEREPAKLSVETLRRGLEQSLPDYMIPVRFMTIPTMPLNSSGKADRKALTKLVGVDVASGTVYETPDSEVERTLVKIWERLLKRTPIGRTDNFFALGGHSLLAVRLTAEIERVMGYKLPGAALFQSPTIQLLARRLTDEDWVPEWNSLVPLQTEGSKPPLICVHGIGGDVFLFQHLHRFLDPEQPCYGIQGFGVDSNSARPPTLEEIVAHYVEELVSFQPEGSFYLAGFSLGGEIAYEIARQLHQQGRRVALLAIMDTVPGGPVPWIYRWLALAAYTPRRAWQHFQDWWKLPSNERINYLRGRWAALRYLMKANTAQPLPPPTRPREDVASSATTGYYDHYHKIAAAYQLQPYPGPADIIISDEITPEWKSYWKYLARGGVTFHRMHGLHLELITPENRPRLAGLLTTLIDRARDKERAFPLRNG